MSGRLLEDQAPELQQDPLGGEQQVVVSQTCELGICALTTTPEPLAGDPQRSAACLPTLQMAGVPTRKHSQPLGSGGGGPIVAGGLHFAKLCLLHGLHHRGLGALGSSRCNQVPPTFPV